MKRYLLILLSCLTLLAGCAHMNRARYADNHSLLPANEYLQMAATAQGAAKQSYLLKATQRLIQDQRPNRAQQILNQIASQTDTDNLTTQKQLLQAQILIIQGASTNAIVLLKKINNDSLNPQQRITFHKTFAKAYLQKGDIISNINQKTDLLPLLTTAEQQQVTRSIWSNLQKLNTSKLRQLFEKTPSHNLRGWLKLSLLTKANHQNPKQFLQALASWKQTYQNHPADALLPKNLKQVVTNQRPQKIALLLPLKGKYKQSAAAIRNGFFAAYYQAKKQNQYTPNIHVIDTSGGNIRALYQQAVQDGADFIVGPLLKQNVMALAGENLPVPTLALNSLANTSTTNLYQFGLTPADDTQQMAIRAWNKHYHHAVIIAPSNAWGQHIATTLAQQWQALGGNIAGQMAYGSQRQLATQVSQLLHTAQSTQRYQTLRWVLHEKMRFITRRRKDVDVIFLVALPTMARQIKPLLNFYYASKIPVYATSQVYHGTLNPRRDHDLNGIQFGDMPWVLTPQQLQPQSLDSIQRSIKTIWPKNYRRYPKLFALGVDAFDVIPKLGNANLLAQLGAHGATGILYLDKNNHLFRQLTWAKISHGKPKVID